MEADAYWSTLDAAFDRALDLDGPDREAYLGSLDPDLRQRLGPLLAAALADDPLLDHARAALAPLAELSQMPEASSARGMEEGVRVGPYRIEGLLGEGGMGRVYRARRADGAFEQTVAVKVVRTSLTLAGADVAARLRRERDLLAALDHPGIARLLDGGETEDGVPYLATELIDGAPITTWADARGLGTAARVRLVVDVARAVDHAHRRFVVHRDLKPSNVLVTERDGAARPVVLDFGIAKLLEAAENPASGAFPLTRTGMRMLTPAYAAPELYDPTATITTSADVYGLGALLYELLTGTRPHEDPASGGTLAPEGAPTRPSLAFDASSEDTRQRRRSLEGDLDTICLKALHTDPARRYGSAAALADDLQRHLEGRPVEARRDSLAYVAGRFARRNRVAVASGAFALLALMGGLVITVASLTQSRADAARAEEAAGLLGGLLGLGNVAEVEGRVPSARDLLDSALVRTERVESEPLRAYLYSVLARAFDANEDPVRADSLLSRMLASLDEMDVESSFRAEVLLRYGVAHTDIGETQAGHALIRRAQREAEPGTALHVRATSTLSWVERSEGEPVEALRYAQQALRLARDLPPEDEHVATVAAYREMGQSYLALQQTAEAIAAFEQAWTLQRKRYGAESLQSAEAAANLGTPYEKAGEIAKAGEVRRLTLRVFQRVLGPDHHQVAGALSAMADQFVLEGDLVRAEAMYDVASVATEKAWGPGRWFVARRFVQLAEVRHELGMYADAEAAAQHAREIYIVKGDTLPNSYGLGNAYVAMGRAQASQARTADARASFRRALRYLVGQNPDASGAESSRRLRREAQAFLARSGNRI